LLLRFGGYYYSKVEEGGQITFTRFKLSFFKEGFKERLSWIRRKFYLLLGLHP